MEPNREIFGSNLMAIFALAGSAIGLGNIWRFPYMVGQHGGAAFIIVYILCTLVFSRPIFYCESIIGRRTGRSSIGAMRQLAPGSRWTLIGVFTVLGPLMITSFYSVVGGWSIAYLLRSCFSSFGAMSHEEIGSLFANFTGSVWGPVLAHTAFLLISAIIISAGVRKGIETFSKYSLPPLVVLMILLMVYSISLPGAHAGVEYMVKPDFSRLDARAIASAMGQSFFSLSLGMGTVLTYASYMSKKDNIFSTGAWTAVFDLGFALIAGFVVMPAVFAAGLEPQAGPGLVFETLPFIFADLGAASPLLSKVVTVVFFLSVLIAALTSEISMYEVCTAYLVEERKMSRRKATVLVFVVAWSIGVACAVLPKVFDFCDFVSSNVLMTLGALAFSLFIGWRMKKAVVEAELTNDGSLPGNRKVFKVFYFLTRYIVPVGIGIIFLSNFITF